MDAQSNSEQVIVKVTERDQEGWLLIPLDDFLKRMDLDAWTEEQHLVGIVLPPSRHRAVN